MPVPQLLPVTSFDFLQTQRARFVRGSEGVGHRPVWQIKMQQWPGARAGGRAGGRQHGSSGSVLGNHQGRAAQYAQLPCRSMLPQSQENWRAWPASRAARPPAARFAHRSPPPPARPDGSCWHVEGGSLHHSQGHAYQGLASQSHQWVPSGRAAKHAHPKTCRHPPGSFSKCQRATPPSLLL